MKSRSCLHLVIFTLFLGNFLGDPKFLNPFFWTLVHFLNLLTCFFLFHRLVSPMLYGGIPVFHCYMHVSIASLVHPPTHITHGVLIVLVPTDPINNKQPLTQCFPNNINNKHPIIKKCYPTKYNLTLYNVLPLLDILLHRSPTDTAARKLRPPMWNTQFPTSHAMAFRDQSWGNGNVHESTILDKKRVEPASVQEERAPGTNQKLGA